jgi:transcriptional regulator with XRE-family HTH domain
MQLAYRPMSPIVLRIKEFRDAREWSQAELSRISKVPQPTISRIEAGRTRSIEFAVLERLARAFGKHPSDLVGMEEGAPTKPRKRGKGAPRG